MSPVMNQAAAVPSEKAPSDDARNIGNLWGLLSVVVATRSEHWEPES